MRSHGAGTRHGTQSRDHNRDSPLGHQFLRTQDRSASLTRKKARDLREKTPKNHAPEVPYRRIPLSRRGLYVRRLRIRERGMEVVKE